MVGFLGRLRGVGIVVIKPVLLHEIGNRLTRQAGEAKGLANNRRPKRGGKVGQAAEVVQDCGIDFGLRHGGNLPVLDLGFGP